MISLRPSVLLTTIGSATKRPAGLYTLTRSYASYPFTKSDSSEPERAAPNPRSTSKSQYPFTRPAEPSQGGSPTRPVDRPGSGGQDFDSVPSLVSEEQSSRAHQPDYNVQADYRTSAFSPIPMRVMDGSEDTDTTAAAVLSGAPLDLQARTVRIYRPAKTATQSGDWHGHQWRMDWDILQKGHRWENPLMGWQSSGDFMQGTKVTFKSKEDAIRFAEKQGYEYFVQEPTERRIVPKAYASQFVHSPGTLKTVRTK